MRQVDFQLPKHAAPVSVEQAVEKVCAANGLTIAMKGALSKYPGSIHWHFKRGKAPGTLELTFVGTKSQLWASVQAGREAPWIDEVLARIKSDIEAFDF